jgi:hypothetical protein
VKGIAPYGRDGGNSEMLFQLLTTRRQIPTFDAKQSHGR